MKHIFRKGTDVHAPVLLLLHGTGGNEHSLLSLAEEVSPTSSVLSVRGNILENGMPRFFRRLAEGVFDEEDLVFRTKELYDFIQSSAKQYEFDAKNVVAIGYSNGANIAASVLYHFQDALKAAILHHPMVPLRNITLPILSGTKVFIGAGTNDPICSPEETEELEKVLLEAKASVTVHWETYGHQLTRSEVNAASKWYKEQFSL
ncbi:dienelactone hydrolase family protein [Shimazuella alba]|uniref:Alpha/beta hydrolase fold domain-containing protein n=1 Tax=Shimazuella alba TaxID=2690964 RepID=A0A6I4VX21_9BACL|nr:alpha/beta hydrolase fold domain-containing protein [Shimazuella alba]